MSEVKAGLEGVVAFETEIAEPDREGGALRSRGVDIEDLVGNVPYEQVWGLLVDESFEPGLPAGEPVELKNGSGRSMSDLQSATAQLSAHWDLGQLIDISDEQAREDLRRVSATMLSIVAQSARVADGESTGVPSATVQGGGSAAERFLLEWRGEADPKHITAIDTYWICTVEHGMNASTFTGRVAASTGADCAAALSSAVGSLSGPLHGGAPGPALDMVFDIGTPARADPFIRAKLDRGDRLMGFGHRVYRVRDPRADVLARAAERYYRQGGDRRLYDLARKVEATALRLLRERRPERKLDTNVEFYTALLLHGLGLSSDLFTPTFAVARVLGWAAHCLEQLRDGRLIRPQSTYIGPADRQYAHGGTSTALGHPKAGKRSAR